MTNEGTLYISPNSYQVKVACLCDIIALASVLFSDVSHVLGRFPGIFRERELALMQHRKVSLPQVDLQINDQGRRLSAGLHASCPIHHQTWQGTFPLGILEIFMEHFHHFYLLLVPSTDPHQLKDEQKQKQGRDLGCGGWRSLSLMEVLLCVPGPLPIATGLLTSCHGSHPTALHHPAAALLVISHRDRLSALSKCSSSTNQLLRFQNCICLSAIV